MSLDHSPISHVISDKPRRNVLRWVQALALFGTLASVGGSRAQSSAPIRLLVGYAPGGPVDSAARLFAPVLSRELGQSVVVENRPGAGGVLAGDLVAKSPANGQVLFFGASPTITISPHVLKSMPFDPLRDLQALAPILSYANVLVVNKEQPFRTVAELQAFARANPGKVSYGSAGMGGSNHLSGELFAKRVGAQMTHVPYKGNAPAMTDVIGGQLTMMFDIIGTGRNYVNTGRVRALAVTSRERNPSLPEVPTMRESGVDFDVGGWYGLYGPPQMSAELVQRFNEATRRALAQEELRSKLVEQGYELWVGAPALLSERAARELALWGTVTQGMKFD
ncbi:MAG: tripartite tricarboxylate transporter substrate binding protein [Betaproteobacteria bacterium]|nr:tripartite tricarboxylate transporter substrate binding protein [Betaproteobacteria bacterium]